MSKSKVISVSLFIMLYLFCNINIPAQGVKNKTIKQSRVPVAGHPLIWSRIQSKYGLYNNYLHYWLDRPLLLRRSLRPKSWIVNTYPNYKLIIEQMKDYGLDGIGVLVGTKGRLPRYSKIARYTDRANLPGFSFTPETGIIPESNEKKLSTYKDEIIIKTEIKSKTATRIHGKVLLCSYFAHAASPRKWARYLAALREKVGDTFYFVAGIGCSSRPWYKIRQEFDKNGGFLDPQTIKDCKAYIRSYLDVCDGVKFGCTMRNHFDKDYYKYTVNIFSEVLSEPKYRKKLFGLSAKIGYINKFTASTLWENQTKTLRESFEGAIAANPDFIILPEWNEANECTSFQPTVMKSFTTKRILKYYTSKLKNEKLEPLTGDDTSIPNLIISYRYELKLGEKLSIELLNVPDSYENKKYTVKLSLLDLNGKLVKAFPAATLETGHMRDITYDIPTENLPSQLVLNPFVEIFQGGKCISRITQGLKHIRIKASYTVNRLCYSQPIRDLLDIKKVKFDIKKDGNDILLAGDIESPKEIASVEILQDGQEIFAVDRKKEFGSRDKNIILFVYYTTLRTKRDFSLKMKVVNTDFTLHPLLRGDNLFKKYKIRGNCVDIKQFAWNNRHGFFLKIPRSNINKAKLEFTANKLNLTVPVKRVLEQKAFSTNFDGVFRLCLKDYKLLPDSPVSVNSKEANFKFKISEKANTNKCFSLRIISKDGKTWRSRPILLQAQSTDKVAYNVDSDTKNKIVGLKIDKSRIPDIKYYFKKDSSTMLYCNAGPKWFAELGGGTEYGQPFGRSKKYYPATAKVSAPEWVKEDGVECLRFDGKGNYINFPHCTLPQGEFTLSMDIKSLSKKKQILFIAHGQYAGPFKLILENGRLKGEYLGRVRPGENILWFKRLRVSSNPIIPLGKWTNIKIIYNLKKIIFKVNNKKCAEIPCSREGFAFTPAVFGGYRRNAYGKLNSFNGFEGYLKSFSIRHSAK
jgi:hypothetical protein